jgi:MipA family protein
MKTRIRKRLALLFAAAAFSATGASAQVPISADPDPTRLADAPNKPGDDWQFQLGAGSLYGPAFLGSEDYQIRLGPNIAVRYKDRFHVSVVDGAGLDLIKTGSLRAGPIVKYQRARRESGDSPFRIAGDRTEALRGLGDVAATVEAGGYLQCQSGGLSAKAEVRRGIDGHEGLIAELGARYTVRLTGMTVAKRPVTVSLGPRARIADDTYSQSYFGVDAGQSVRSGLAQFEAQGGLISYGIGASIVVPVSGHLSAAVLGGFDRLSGDARNSPLVLERGSVNQRTIGLGLTYRFGL